MGVEQIRVTSLQNSIITLGVLVMGFISAGVLSQFCSRRFSAKRIYMAVIALALICLLLLPFVVYKEGQWLLAVAFGTIYGIVLAVFYSISYAALSNMVPKSHESQYVGIEAFFTYCARPVTPLLYA